MENAKTKRQKGLFFAYKKKLSTRGNDQPAQKKRKFLICINERQFRDTRRI